MILYGAVWRFILLLVCLAFSGCMPPAQSAVDEEKEPHFLAGRNRAREMDYKGAIDCYEKSLESNPRSASAHFELGWLYDQKEADPSAAIFHYQQYLKLRPHAENADLVKGHIMAGKQELARTVSLGPITQTMQREFEKIEEENKNLRAEVEKWRNLYTNAIRGASQPGPASAGPTATRTQTNPGANQGGDSAGRAPRSSDLGASTRSGAGGAGAVSSNSSAGMRTHTIQAGETPTAIAKSYGIKVDALLAANPKVDPRRMKPGQTLMIPARQ
jgi:LysM repeat protein